MSDLFARLATRQSEAPVVRPRARSRFEPERFVMPAVGSVSAGARSEDAGDGGARRHFAGSAQPVTNDVSPPASTDIGSIDRGHRDLRDEQGARDRQLANQQSERSHVIMDRGADDTLGEKRPKAASVKVPLETQSPNDYSTAHASFGNIQQSNDAVADLARLLETLNRTTSASSASSAVQALAPSPKDYLPRRTQRTQRGTAMRGTSEEPHVVHVRIGRVDVRAAPPAPAPRQAPAHNNHQSPGPSLEEHLSRRSGA